MAKRTSKNRPAADRAKEIGHTIEEPITSVPPAVVIGIDDPCYDGVSRHYYKCSGRAIPVLSGGDAVLTADDDYALYALENYHVRIGSSGRAERIKTIAAAINEFKTYKKHNERNRP